MNSVSWLFSILLTIQLIGGARLEIPKESFKDEFAKASCDFSVDLVKTAGLESNENLVLSPSSIGVLLAILQQGAKENTAVQLEKVLRLSAENSKLGYHDVIKSLQGEKTNLTIKWGNRAYVVPGFELEQNYLTTVQENFNATIVELDFRTSTPMEAATKINDWVKEATHDNIKDLVDASLLTSEIDMIMVNAIFFKSIWDSPFHKYKTRAESFRIDKDKAVEVPFMRQVGRFFAGEDTQMGIKWAALPFKDENFSMIFILPIESHNLKEVISGLSGSYLKQIIDSENTRQVKLTIPKFKLTKKISLAETLKQIGLTDVFTNDANFKGISNGNKTLRLSQLIHQANVEIDEDGSTAAAATFEVVQTLSLEWFSDELLFRADHPFLFFIVDKVNKVPLFVGKITDPNTSVFK